MDYSACHLLSSSEKYRCGYCNSSNGSICDSFVTPQLLVDSYQRLIDRGWRRSGKLCYKPRMKEICCPQYTIRCDTTNFKLSKSQKRVMKKMIKFLSNGVLEKNSNEHDSDEGLEMETNKIVKTVKKGQGPDPNKPFCKKAKQLRLERKLQKFDKKISEESNSVESGSDSMPIKINESNQSKTLEDFFNELNSIESPVHKLKIETIESSKIQGSTSEKLELELFSKYQTKIHLESLESCSKRRYCRFLIDSPLKIEIKQMNDQESTFNESYELYSKYQKIIHKDRQSDCSVENYVNFLIESPLISLKSENSSIQYGSFHQQYWLDDKLIAVGVIDILPNCLSSVYFFYDPDYNHLSLGVFGALFEISNIRKWQDSLPYLKFYYMGYYIHTCQKMRYKISMSPSYLLCPETYVWIEAEKCLSKFNKQPYNRLQDDDSPETDKFEYFSRKTFVYWDGTTIKMIQFLNRFPVYRNTVEKFAKLFGQHCANHIIIIGIHD